MRAIHLLVGHRLLTIHLLAGLLHLLVPRLLLVVQILILFVLLFQGGHCALSLCACGPGAVQAGGHLIGKILPTALHLRLERFQADLFLTGALPLQDAGAESLLKTELVLLELLRVGGGGLWEDHEVLHHLLDLCLQLRDLVPATLLLRLLRLLHLLLLLGSLLLRLLLHLLLILLSLHGPLLHSRCLNALVSSLLRLWWPRNLLRLLGRGVARVPLPSTQLLHDLSAGVLNLGLGVILRLASLRVVVEGVPEVHQALLVRLLLARIEMWQRVDLLRPNHGHGRSRHDCD